MEILTVVFVVLVAVALLVALSCFKLSGEISEEERQREALAKKNRKGEE